MVRAGFYSSSWKPGFRLGFGKVRLSQILCGTLNVPQCAMRKCFFGMNTMCRRVIIENVMEENEGMRELLEENLRLAKDNNRMLRSARNSARLGFVGRILFWIVMLGIPTYIYVAYLAPIVSSVVPAGGVSGNPILKALGLPSVDSIQKALGALTTFSHTATHTVQNITNTH